MNGFDAFRFFTTDSNVLVAIASVTVAIADIRILLGKTENLPKAALYRQTVQCCQAAKEFFTISMPLRKPYVSAGLTARAAKLTAKQCKDSVRGRKTVPGRN